MGIIVRRIRGRRLTTVARSEYKLWENHFRLIATNRIGVGLFLILPKPDKHGVDAGLDAAHYLGRHIAAGETANRLAVSFKKPALVLAHELKCLARLQMSEGLMNRVS